MGPFEILLDEHRVIERVLASLEKMADRFQEEKRIDPEPAEEALDFIRNFADRCHHGKEEARLFRILETKDRFPKGCGPSYVLRAEHAHGRTLVGCMAEAIADAREGRATALDRFLRSARTYIALLRQHIGKEDNCFFPNANMSLTAEEDRRLSVEFEEFEREEMGAGTHEKYRAMADSLYKRFGTSETWWSSRVKECHHGEGS